MANETFKNMILTENMNTVASCDEPLHKPKGCDEQGRKAPVVNSNIRPFQTEWHNSNTSLLWVLFSVPVEIALHLMLQYV